MSNDVIELVNFSEIDLQSPFFDSLKEDYKDFENWFKRKAIQGEKAYILQKNNLLGFLYLKDENEEDKTINPPFEKKRRLKIGTFKIEAHGTVLGERFIGIILKKMIEEGYQESYVTIFEKYQPLINLFEKFGFVLWGKKENNELVYIKTLDFQNNIYKDFPRIVTQNNKKYLLSIYPKYHTKLFPNSRLRTEKDHRIEDLSFTNTIEKVYLSGIKEVEMIKCGDLVVIYRTADLGKKAEWSSVATSICTVIETKKINDFTVFTDFRKYCGKGSVFKENELLRFWKNKRYPYIIKMLYNISLPKRIVRHSLIENSIINRNDYVGFVSLSDFQFKKILELGEVNESYIIN